MHAAVIAPIPTPSARNARRQREDARRAQARVEAPALRIARLEPVHALLRSYRAGASQGLEPLLELLAEVDLEVRLLEAVVARRSRADHRAGPAIRRALTLLKDFGRLSVLDFDVLPVEGRPHLVRLLALEYRWCFAAAGTTPRAFKIAIGRTGAR